MRFVFHTICVSPHQMPWASELAHLCGDDGFVYLYEEPLAEDRQKLGWSEGAAVHKWLVHARDKGVDARTLMIDADVLVSGMREVDVFEARAKLGRHSFYTSERWLKPPIGILRLLFPRYLNMARRMTHLFRSGSVTYLPTGVTAAADMARIVGLLSGHFANVVRAPKIAYENCPMGSVDGYPWMRMWGYFVAPSQLPLRSPLTTNSQQLTTARALRVLWVGRMLALKRVDTLVRAVYACARNGENVELTLVGGGEVEARLRRLDEALAAKSGCHKVKFCPAVPIERVREVMRDHDVYVFPSNGYDGWGAVVSEALEEGMEVFGSDEAGSSRTMLPTCCLFKVGDWRQLARILVLASKGERHCTGIGPWSSKNAAEKFLEYAGACG